MVPDGDWHHLVGVCDEVNGQIYLYVDGQLNASAAASGGILTSPNLYLTIGARQAAAEPTTISSSTATSAKSPPTTMP